MVTEQQKKLIEDFFKGIVNGYTNKEIIEFIRKAENKAIIDKFSMTEKEIDRVVGQCHRHQFESIKEGVGVSPYTLVSPDFLDESLDKEVERIAPKFLDVINCLQRYYNDFDTIFNTIKLSVQSSAMNLITTRIPEAAKKAEEEAVKRSSERAQRTEDIAKRAESNAKLALESAADIVQVEVKKEANSVAKELKADLTKTASETTVTVLGIFAAIVITIISGLIFSSSVFQNMNDASVFRLVLTSSLVGMVCMNMIASMIRYISRIAEKDIIEWNSKWNRHDRVIDSVNIFSCPFDKCFLCLHLYI